MVEDRPRRRIPRRQLYRNPAWEVLSGEYFIEQGWGLRNRILTNAGEKKSSSSGGGGDEFAKVLLGSILEKAAGVENKPGPVENAIVSRVPVSNAFAVAVEVSSWADKGHFEIGVFQGDDAVNGYRLVYASGKGLQLHRVGSRGTSVVDTSTDPVVLEDKKFHNVVWTRGGDGAMTVSIDGKSMISVTDRAFSDAFDSFRFSNRAGDFIVKRVTVEGV